MNYVKKVLIINAYSYKNRGDSGIIVAMLDVIKEAYGESVEISVMSQFYDENIEFYDKLNVKSVAPIWDIKTQKGFLSKYITGIKKVLFYKSQDTREIDEADIILSAGGGYLYSSRIGPFGVGFINVLYHLWLAKKNGKKVILFPQSVGPLHYSFDRFILKRVIKKMDLFYSREKITTKLLQENNLNSIVKQVPDIAFILDPIQSTFVNDCMENSSGSLRIGVTVLDWRFAYRGSNLEDVDSYLSKIADSILDLRKEINQKIEVFIFPQVTVSEDDGDVIVSKKLLDKIKKSVTIMSLDNINNPKELVYLYSKMDLFIGSRMHSAIFALAGGVPTIALAYQPKTTGTFELIELGDYVLEAKIFEVEDLKDKMRQLLISKTKSRSDIKAIILGVKNEIKKELVHCLRN